MPLAIPRDSFGHAEWRQKDIAYALETRSRRIDIGPAPTLCPRITISSLTSAFPPPVYRELAAYMSYSTLRHCRRSKMRLMYAVPIRDRGSTLARMPMIDDGGGGSQVVCDVSAAVERSFALRIACSPGLSPTSNKICTPSVLHRMYVAEDSGTEHGRSRRSSPQFDTCCDTYSGCSARSTGCLSMPRRGHDSTSFNSKQVIVRVFPSLQK